MDDFIRLLEQLNAAGWVCEKTGRGHWKLRPPDPNKPLVYAASTPSDRRAFNNLLAQVKRSGYAPRRGRPPKKAKPLPSEVPAASPGPELHEQPTPETTEPTRLAHDIAVLDRALGVLADVEDVIKRYKGALEALKDLL